MRRVGMVGEMGNFNITLNYAGWTDRLLTTDNEVSVSVSSTISIRDAKGDG